MKIKEREGSFNRFIHRITGNMFRSHLSMKKYNPDMNFFDFVDLTKGLGFRFSLVRCGNPCFRKHILEQLEAGISKEEINAEYYLKFYGIDLKKMTKGEVAE